MCELCKIALYNATENYLRAVEFREPDWVPCNVSIDPIIWYRCREELEEIVLKHPSIFGDYKKGSINFDEFGVRSRGKIYEDEWGCVWHHFQDGLVGQVKVHPLEDWKVLKSYEPPAPLELKGPPQTDSPPIETWDQTRRRLKEDREKGRLVRGYVPHNTLFQRMYDLRGFKNFLIDTVTRPENVARLVDMVIDYNLKLVEWWLENNVDIISFGDDLGTQTRLTINPERFRRLFIPAYNRMFKTCREAGAHVHFHSDGHIMEISEDLVKAGVSILNLQDLVNGINNIKRKLRGKVCIDLDIDRQRILPFGSPEDVKKHVRTAVSTLNSPDGGLMIQVYPCSPTPLKNIRALCEALEKMGAGIKDEEMTIKW